MTGKSGLCKKCREIITIPEKHKDKHRIKDGGIAMSFLNEVKFIKRCLNAILIIIAIFVLMQIISSRYYIAACGDVSTYKLDRWTGKVQFYVAGEEYKEN